jgi:hypothetical protein
MQRSVDRYIDNTAERSQQPLYSALLSIAAGILAILLLCVPGFLNRSPLMYPDTRSYFLGGRAVVDKVITVLYHLMGPVAVKGSPMIEAQVQQARGVRSAYYSLFAYLLTITGTVWAVIFVQAALTASIILMVHRTFRPDQPRHRVLVTLALMTGLSSLPWTVSVMLPDIFTPLLVLSLGGVLIQWPSLSKLMRTALLIMIGVCITMHITNLPIAIALTLVIMGLQWRMLRSRLASYAAVTSVTLVAILAMLIVGVVGFGEWSIQPQSPPFLTARSLDDGPGKLYLQEHCPQLNFAMCRHLDRINVGADDFIWHFNGVYSVVPREEQAEMRAEDKKLFLLAAAAHPFLQARAMLENTISQLFQFSLADTRIPSYSEFIDEDMRLTIPATIPNWMVALSVIDYFVVFASCFVIRWLWTSNRLTRSAKHLIVVVLAALILNAFAGAISLPAHRFEARIIWLLPLMVGVFWCTRPVSDRVLVGADL